MTLIFLALLLTVSVNNPAAGNTFNKTQADTVYSDRIIEKVYLHTDRSYYYPGDDIWFKAYLVEAYDRSFSKLSRNLHVELISPSAKIIASRIVKLDSGLGRGDFKLPYDLNPGIYRLRAYTNYMRNFREEIFFNKEINIIRSSAGIKQAAGNNKHEVNSVKLSFFPEGGSLVDNVSSIVAFKAVDAEGKSCSVSGEVYSSAGEMISGFKSTHLGMGTFVLTPDPGLSYYTLADGDGDGDGDTEIRSEIPKSFQTGVTFGASINTDNRLTVTIRTNEETLPLLEGHELLLSISVRKEVLKTISLKINSLSNSFILPLDDLPDGIIMLTLTTLENFPLSERLLFIQRDNNLRISIQPDKEVYKQHDPAAVKLTVSGNSSKEETVFLSLSAAEGNFSDDPAEFRTTISSWFLLESDVHGTVEGAYWYFDQANPDRKRDLDLLLRTQGWRDFSWKYDTTEFFYPEFGFNISGRLRKLNNDKPLVDSKANFMIIQGDKTLSEIVPADNTGRFMLENIDITGEASLIVSAVDRTDRPNGMIILDPVEYIPEKITDYISAPGVTKKEEFLQPIQADAMKEKEEVLVQEFEIREAIRKQYKLSDTIELREIIIAAQKPKDLQVARIESVRSIYGEPDGEVVVTSQLEKSIHAAPELLMGTVAGVYVTGPVRGHYSIRFTRSMGLSGSQGGSPLLVIDGVKRPLETLDLLPVAIIDRIDVLKTIGKTAVFGIDGANGVISVITRSGDRVTEKDEEAKHSVSTIIKGYDVPRIFYAPDSNPASSIPYNPDLRTTLLWKPDIILPVNGELILKYLNADNSATVRIIVEGLSSTGIPVSSTKEYKVTD